MIRAAYVLTFSIATVALVGCNFLSPSQPVWGEPNSAGSSAVAVVRGQDYGYGGRSVGATSPQDARAPSSGYTSQPPAPTTPGQAAWQQPGAPPTYRPPYSPQPVVPSNPWAPANSGTAASPVANATNRYAPTTPGAAGAVVTPVPPTYSPNAVYAPTTPTQLNSAYSPGTIQPVAIPSYGPLDGPPRGSGVDPLFTQPLPEGYGVGPILTPNPDGTVDIDAIVHEARTGRLMIGAGINSDAGLIGQVVIEEQNFDWRRFPTSWDDIRNGTAWRGGGQRFRVEAMPGSQFERYTASFQEPYLFDTPISFGIQAFFYDRRFFDWDERRAGGRMSLGYQLPNDWAITGALRAEQVEVHNPRVVPAVPEIARVLGDNDAFSFKVALTHDVRDNAFMPTEGHFLELAYEQVFGSFDYPVATAEARKYFTLSQRVDTSGRHVLGLGGVIGLAGTDVPLYDSFFAGGATTLRGFQFRSASPKNGDVIVGGSFQLLTTAEYMFPITADDMLRGVLFVDAGTVEKDFEINGDSFRVAPGFGLRIAHPALGPAPIALDLAFPVMRDETDRIRNFTFFIGIRR